MKKVLTFIGAILVGFGIYEIFAQQNPYLPAVPDVNAWITVDLTDSTSFRIQFNNGQSFSYKMAGTTVTVRLTQGITKSFTGEQIKTAIGNSK